MLIGVIVIYYHLWSHTLKLIDLLNITIFLAFFPIPLLAISKYSKQFLPHTFNPSHHNNFMMKLPQLEGWNLENNICVPNPCIYSSNISTHCHTKLYFVMLPQTGFRYQYIFHSMLVPESDPFQLPDYLDSQNILLRSGIVETSMTPDTKSELLLFRSISY